ncbi:hypothetical protein ACIFOE_20530 [Paenibacillus sp. NRS-1783]|uniref:hypothetical protein n=1 Tax=Paenibacillus sp. NRS-1783 TaxID=3233907 RepID=UPI003D28D4BB
MTIALNKLQPTQSTTNNKEVSAMNTMFEQLFIEFEIKPTAVILINLMKFHLNTVERMNEFANRMLYEDSPFALIVKMWKEDVDAHSYTDKADFVYDYYRNKKAAFEKLFQEPAHEWKLNRFTCDDPERIYDTYLKLDKYSHMTEVAMFA